MPGVTYDVPLILPGLRKEESVFQMVNALEYLQQVSNDVFSKIEKRVAENREQIAAIDRRANLALAKIEKIRGSRKAIRVFSSAKYPAPDKLEMYTSLHTCDGLDDNPLPSVDQNYHVASKFPKADHNSLKEKLQFYNVQLNTSKRKTDRADQGLGGLPKDITSISSLLLFNTTENPYKKYVILDPLEGAVTKTRKGLDEEDEDLAAAPVTITNREEMDLLGLTNYFYVPNLGDVPELDVPVHLPDLPGIADDLAWSADLGPSIAPSVPGSNVPELPEVIPEEPAPAAQPNTESSSSSLYTPPPPPPPDPGVPPPPPPPPPPQPMEVESPGPTAPGPAPTEVAQPESNGDGGGGRADLMAAIRNAGGAGKAKLKKAKERKQKKRAEKEQPASGGGDLMTDLFAKLQMRRKGISGSRGDRGGDETGGGSAMDKISSMIPPPSNMSGSSLANDSGEWDA
ncbi:WASH complex subunit 1-like [Dendronephthya gigantea]|uniref:WASH complex subunit 1-like n=1 Tax=Dendronephthya gigantea TaxID=151771 RepID=UPI00106AD4FF|nr:WASH complex subunit 1-like [Dendronephthya gigantea]